MRRRRPPGTGSFERLPSGSIRAVLCIRGQRVSRAFPTRADAETWLARERARAGELGDAPNARLSDLREFYLAEIQRRGLTRSTIDGHRQHLAAVLARWGDVRVRDLTGPVLMRIASTMERLGWAPSTVRNRLDRITSLARMAMEYGIVEPRALPVRRPRITLASRPDPYTDGEIRGLLDEAARRDDPRYLAAIALGAFAGLRASEIMRVQARDLDDKRRVLLVPVRSAVDRPKSGRERAVPVPPSVVAALQACPARRHELVVGRPSWSAAWNLRHWLLDVWASAGVQGGCHLHRLRHWWATSVARQGASALELMSWGGWTSPTMVRRYYHGPDEARHELVAGLDELLVGDPGFRAIPTSAGVEAEKARKVP